MLVPTIGVEVHVELKSTKKVFSPSRNEFSVEPNVNLNEIDYALPGTLPLLNKEVVDLALKASLALHCTINQTMHFDRKAYFYPDLPKGYQITQKDTPIGYQGYLEIEVAGIKKKITIERVQIEEDTCKSTHTGQGTYLDFNRAGVPLIEIVSDPVIESGEEAMLYLEKLRETLLYLEISDVKIEEGSMRCDANVSLKEKESTTFGTKTEIKNIGSIADVATSIHYEIKRQKEILENGDKVKSETRRFDDATETTISMRSKETGNDYRYYPEPDIPTIRIDDVWLEEARKNIPLLPDDYRLCYRSKGINENNIKTLIQYPFLTSFLYPILEVTDAVVAANLLTGEVLSFLNKNNLGWNDIKLDEANFQELIAAMSANQISSKQGKEVLAILLSEGGAVGTIIEKLGLTQISDQDQLSTIVQEVVLANPESVQDYQAGLDRAVKYLMGQIMKASKGKANPQLVNQLLLEFLKKKSI